MTLQRVASWILRLALLLVFVVAGAVVMIRHRSAKGLDRQWTIPAETVAIPEDSASITYGAHVAALLGCAGCHGPDLAGRRFLETPGVVTVWAGNLTSGAGGIGSRYTDADWVRAIRHAVGPNGRGLWFMPSQNYQRLNDRDLGALVAWLKSRPAVGAEIPPRSIGLGGRLLYLRGMLPLVTAEHLQHDAPRAAAIEPGPTVAYGAYLAGGCVGCHGENFSGGQIPGGPAAMLPARNLTPDSATGIGRWSFEDFRIAMRFGQLPEGVVMDSLAMPIAVSREYTDEELAALFAYFRSLPARPYGGN
jgi:mono/diheme cytochrome c family protein